MKAQNVRSAFVLLGAVVISLANTGCGGSSSNSPPPSPITVSVSPATATVQEGLTQKFTVTVNNDSANKGVTWGLSCGIATGCGSLSATSTPSGTTVTYTALGSTALSDPATVTVRATSVADITKSATATVTIPIPPSVALVPTVGLTRGSGTMVLQIQAQSGPNGAEVTLGVGGCSGGATVCGSMVGNGCGNTSFCFTSYLAPATPPPGGQVTVIATSTIDPTISATATGVGRRRCTQAQAPPEV